MKSKSISVSLLMSLIVFSTSFNSAFASNVSNTNEINIVKNTGYKTMRIEGIERLSVRADKSTSSKFLGYAYSSEEVYVYDIDSKWAKIKQGDMEGYVLSEYLVEGEYIEQSIEGIDKLSVRLGPSTKHEFVGYVKKSDGPIKVYGYEGNFAVVKYEGKKCYVMKEYLKDLDIESKYIDLSKISKLSVYSSTDSSKKWLGYVYSDKAVNVIQNEGKWAKIKIGEKYGYVLNEYLVSNHSNVGKFVVGIDKLSVRKEATTDSEYIGAVKGEVNVLGYSGDLKKEGIEWAKINYNGVESYVLGEYLKDSPGAVDNEIKEDPKVAIVIDMIKSLDRDITISDEDLVINTRNEYNDLSDDSKEKVSNIDILELAEKKISHLKQQQKLVDDVTEMIAGLDREITLSDKQLVKDVRALYDQIIDEDMRNMVSNYSLLEKAEKTIYDIEIQNENIAKAQDLVRRIEGYNRDIEYADINVIRILRHEFDNLRPEAKALVTNIQVLENAEVKADEIVRRIGNVVNLIAKIPEKVELSDKVQVETAREEYNKLDASEKLGVTRFHLDILISAEERLHRLETINEHEDLKAFVDTVKALPGIELITVEDESKLIEARNMYNDIKDELKFAVGEEFTLLLSLEQKVSELK